MVGTSTIVAMYITLMITMLLPIAFLFFYTYKHKEDGVVSAWFLGAAGFFISQLLLRNPVLSILGSQKGFTDFIEKNYVAYALMLAVSAAVFEVIARYVVARIIKSRLNFHNSIATGLGHGGIEAIAIVGVAYISNLMYVNMINQGSIENVIQQAESKGVDATPIRELVEVLTNTPAYVFALSGYERFLTMFLQVAMSLIVCYFVWKKQDIKGIGICILLHSLLDGVVGLIAGLATPYLGNVISQNTSYVIIYSFLTLFAIAMIYIIFKIKKEWEKEPQIPVMR